MEEINNGQQYLQVVQMDNDELKRMGYNTSYEFVEYGQQQVIQVQSPDQLQPNSQVVYQTQEQPHYLQVQGDDGRQIVYHHVQQPQQEETVNEPQYILELQTPQEQAAQQQAAYNQQIRLQQQQQVQVPVQQAQPQQTQVVQMQFSPQRTLLVQQPHQATPQQYYVAAATPTQPQTQYYMQTQQAEPQTQTRIVYQTAPQQAQSQTYQIQTQPQQQRIIFQPARQQQILQQPVQQQVRPQMQPQQQQLQQQQQHILHQQGIRVVTRPNMPPDQLQIQRLQVPVQQTQVQQPQLRPVVLRPQRTPRPRQPRAQTPRTPRAAVLQNPGGIQQPTPVAGQPKQVIYRITTPQALRQNSPAATAGQKVALQRVGSNLVRLQGGQKIIVSSGTGTNIGGQQFKYVQQAPQNRQQVVTQSPQIVQQVQQQQQPIVQQKAIGGDDMDDIESNITAVIVQKQGNEPQEEQRTLPVKYGTPPVQKKSITGPQTAIRSASSISSRSSDDSSADRESAKMLVILQNGEQRLITFTLPKETCTVQELLEQVGVPFSADSNIRCISNPGADIDYVVTVGVSIEDSNDLIASAESALKPTQPQVTTQPQQQHPPQQMLVKNDKNPFAVQQKPSTPADTESNVKKPDEIPPKYVNGYFALCNYCGTTSLDHAKCGRCKRVFKDNIKIIPIPKQTAPVQRVATLPVATNADGESPGGAQKRQINQLLNKTPPNLVSNRGRGGSSARGRGRGRGKVEEPVILTLSSDEEDNSSQTSKSNNGNGLTVAKNGQIIKNERNMSTPLKCEPVITGVNPIPADFCRHDVSSGTKLVEFLCRNIRIGTHKYDPTEKVIFSSRGCRIVAPGVKHPEEKVVLNVQSSEIVKLVYCFDKRLIVIFLYVLPSCGNYIRESLEMVEFTDVAYFNPTEVNNTKNKIVILIEKAGTEEKEKLKAIFSAAKIEEIPYSDANELLLRSHRDPNAKTNQNINAFSSGNYGEKVDLLVYPKEGKGRIPINLNDYACLAIDQYLNDVIIDFYIKYLVNEHLTEDQKKSMHYFSSFFYKRLTTMDKKNYGNAVKLTAAQKRYERVRKWNKSVDLFKKDFIIIPINEQSHWFLAIICFPRLQCPVTADGERPVKTPLVKRVRKKNAEAAAAKKQSESQLTSVQIGNTTITAMKKSKDDTIEVPGDESERDEAEGDDSELNSEDSGEEDTADPNQQPIKQPCILIFDSLASASRSRVVATLRDYLTCEYKAKNPSNPNPIVFTKDNLPGHCVKVPQQNNFTDCGLYLLQYVEEFFAQPIKDWRIPIKGLQNWFDVLTVTKKREDISKLLEKLLKEYDPSKLPLPVLEFPTKDGVLLETDEPPEFEEAETDNENDPDYEVEGVKPKRRKTDEN